MGRRILNPGGLAFLAFAFLLCANLALEPCSVRRGAPHIAPTASAAVSFKDVRYDEGRDSFGTAPEGEKSGDFGSVLGFSVEPLEKVEPGLSPKDARIASALRFRSRGRSLVGGLFAPVVAASAILFLSLACFKSLRGRSHRRRLADRPPGDAPCEQGAVSLERTGSGFSSRSTCFGGWFSVRYSACVCCVGLAERWRGGCSSSCFSSGKRGVPCVHVSDKRSLFRAEPRGLFASPGVSGLSSLSRVFSAIDA